VNRSALTPSARRGRLKVSREASGWPSRELASNDEVEGGHVAAEHFVEQAARARVGSRGSGRRRRSRWEGVAEEEGRGRVRTGDMGVHGGSASSSRSGGGGGITRPWTGTAAAWHGIVTTSHRAGAEEVEAACDGVEEEAAVDIVGVGDDGCHT
jgi:hypothetical protein